jgi:tRNA(Ile)-lysidine synthase TilS/MesJ
MHALRAYAERHKLSYYSDPSNRDTSFSRNYLRHEIMPLLRQRFGAHVDRQVVHLQQSWPTISVNGRASCRYSASAL